MIAASELRDAVRFERAELVEDEGGGRQTQWVEVVTTRAKVSRPRSVAADAQRVHDGVLTAEPLLDLLVRATPATRTLRSGNVARILATGEAVEIGTAFPSARHRGLIEIRGKVTGAV